MPTKNTSSGAPRGEKKGKAPVWLQTLRLSIKNEHGVGWRIEKTKSDFFKLIHEPPGEPKCSVTLPLPFRSDQNTKVLTSIQARRELMEMNPDRPLTLAQAHECLKEAPSDNPGELNWDLVAERFAEHRIKVDGIKQSNYDENEAYRVRRILSLLQQPRRAPRDAITLMEAYEKQFLSNLAPGSKGRARNLLTVDQFLRFAVKKCSARPRQWLPPETEERSELVGMVPSDETVDERGKVPVRPEQLGALLRSLETDHPELWLAVALVGLLGLRPSELKVLSFNEDNQLIIGRVKNNRATAKARSRGETSKFTRHAVPLDLKELPGEGARAIALLRSGLTKLPKGIRNAKTLKDAGAAFRQYLDRLPLWASMVEATPGLTPYGLRHGYAWRGSRYYDNEIPVRDLAVMMGHDPATHSKHYGVWTSNADVLHSVVRATGSNPLIPTES